MIPTIKRWIETVVSGSSEKPAPEAYNIWSRDYDDQPENLVLALDEEIFTGLLNEVSVQQAVVADVGCGTGRHWARIFQEKPDELIGFDVSSGMLGKLKIKYPAASVHLITDNYLHVLSGQSVDCLISTLTIAHMKDPEEAIQSWSRVLKPGGHLIITDYHPAVLSRGGRRTFKHQGRSFSVVNYIHPVGHLKWIFEQEGFKLLRFSERKIDEDVRSNYESQDALKVYHRFKGLPVIYGMLLTKEDDTP